jgi:hypothetical protein
MEYKKYLAAIEENYHEIAGSLAEMLKEFDKRLNRYQTDVYLYLDENGKPYLDTFVNVGGNSWLNDEHRTIYADREHYESIYEYFNDIEELADAVGMEKEDLIEMTREAKGLEDDEDVDFSDCRSYIDDDSDLKEKIQTAYEEILDDCGTDYTDRAKEILNEEIEALKRDIEQDENWGN